MLSDFGFSYFYINSKNEDDPTCASNSRMLYLYLLPRSDPVTDDKNSRVELAVGT